VLVMIFNTRLRMLEHALKHPRQRGDVPSLITGLRKLVARIPRDTFAVKQLWPEIETAWDDDFWGYLSSDRIALLRYKVGPLLRYVPRVDVQAETFISKVEQLKEQIVLDVDTAALAGSIVEDVSYLPKEALRDPEAESMWVWCRSYDRPIETATTAQLDQLIAVLAHRMHLRRKERPKALILDLPDFTETRGYILLHGGSERIYVTEYKQRVKERIDALVGAEPTIQALMRGEAVSDEQLIALERTLRRELGGELDLSETMIRKAYTYKVGSLIEFVRRLQELDGIPDYAEIVTRQFEAYIAAHSFTTDQSNFLRTVGSRLIERHQVTEADLYDPPFTYFGMDAVDRWFTAEQRADLLCFAASLAAKGA
jgi:type I restriction enzyme R subunit